MQLGSSIISPRQRQPPAGAEPPRLPLTPRAEQYPTSAPPPPRPRSRPSVPPLRLGPQAGACGTSGSDMQQAHRSAADGCAQPHPAEAGVSTTSQRSAMRSNTEGSQGPTTGGRGSRDPPVSPPLKPLSARGMGQTLQLDGAGMCTGYDASSVPQVCSPIEPCSTENFKGYFFYGGSAVNHQSALRFRSVKT